MPTSDPIRIFSSYSSADEAFRRELENHLSVLKRAGLVETWNFRQIEAGDNWRRKIDAQLNRASIILLLVSADFLASDYCWQVEMKRALERHRDAEAVVIPIILRDCDWTATPFSNLQALPTAGKPVTRWRPRDRAWSDVVAGIRKRAEAFAVAKPHAQPQPSAPRDEDARSLSSAQIREIAQYLKAWPAYRNVMNRRRVHVCASPTSPDARLYAAQLRLAFERGDVWSEEVWDFTWGSDLDDREQFRKENADMLAAHQANVTVWGSDTESHEGEPLDQVILKALSLADVRATHRSGPTSIGGIIAVIVGAAREGPESEIARDATDAVSCEQSAQCSDCGGPMQISSDHAGLYICPRCGSLAMSPHPISRRRLTPRRS